MQDTIVHLEIEERPANFLFKHFSKSPLLNFKCTFLKMLKYQGIVQKNKVVGRRRLAVIGYLECYLHEHCPEN